MKHRILLLSLTILFLVYCKKKKDPTEEVKPDVIVYQNILDTTLSSIKGYTYYIVTSPCSEPVPKDSTAYFDLDLDNDKVIDFRISILHAPYTPNQYCGHCPVYSQYIGIKPMTSNCFVSTIKAGINVTRSYKESESIVLSDSWSNNNTDCFDSGCSVNLYLASPYWGLKIDNKVGWIKVGAGPDYGIIISEFAFNQTENKLILAGQKQ